MTGWFLHETYLYVPPLKVQRTSFQGRLNLSNKSNILLFVCSAVDDDTDLKIFQLVLQNLEDIDASFLLF
ncbi:hypothetical protein ACS65S_13630 [Staphylococcus saprophyticus]